MPANLGQQAIVLLDRDGVINRDSDQYVKSAAEWEALPGSIEAIAGLSQAGYTVVVCTNQSGLGRGLFSLDDLEAMHDKMRALVESAGGEVSAIYYCPHTPDDACDCRKPLPGMLRAIADDYRQDLTGCFFVGDSLRDLQAAVAGDCRPVLVKTGKGEKTLGQLRRLEGDHRYFLQQVPVPVFESLAAFAADLLDKT